MTEELNHKKVKGRVTILKAVLYKGYKIIIRKIGKDYFEYLIPFNNEIYSNFMIIKPKKGSKKLTLSEIAECCELIYVGAESTIDALLGIEADDTVKNVVEIFENNREKIDNK